MSIYSNLIIWYFFACLFLCWTIEVVDAAKRPNQVKKDKAWQARKSQCEQQQCVHLIPEEGFNCVNNCTSTSCYDSIYASNPLEDGEIDFERNRAFTTCLRKEQNDDWVSLDFPLHNTYHTPITNDCICE